MAAMCRATVTNTDQQAFFSHQKYLARNPDSSKAGAFQDLINSRRSTAGPRSKRATAMGAVVGLESWNSIDEGTPPPCLSGMRDVCWQLCYWALAEERELANPGSFHGRAEPGILPGSHHTVCHAPLGKLPPQRSPGCGASCSLHLREHN